jgi:hypothetical protein
MNSTKNKKKIVTNKVTKTKYENDEYVDFLLEDEEDLLQEAQEYVRENIPEYVRKESLLY